MNNELKTMIKKTYELCDSLDGMRDWQLDMSLKEVLKLDLMQLAMYISASDGTIAYQEARIISEIIEAPIDPATVSSMIQRHNVYSTEFESKAPLSLQIFVMADNALMEAGVEIGTPLSELSLKLFKGIVQEVANADGEVDDQEQEDWNIYSNMLEGYLTDNLLSRKAGVRTGFTKASGVSAPTKGGSVSAPKKG